MKRLIASICLLGLLVGCSAQSNAGTANEFETSMRESYDILTKAFDDGTRELTRKEKDCLSYLLYDKEYDIESGTDDYSFYQALQKYQTAYSGYQLETADYSELIDAKESADERF